MSINQIKDSILNANKIGITFHTSPDGDAIGSALGLLNGLRELRKDSYITSRDVIPDNLSFLSLGEEINGETPSPIEGTDLVIVVDCGNAERISSDLSSFNGTVINIDHHLSNEMYGEINYVDTEAAATAEIIYMLLEEMGIKFNEENDVNKTIGTCLYTSLVTDTGSFRHSNVTKRTHFISGELIGCGVNNSKIHSNLFDNTPVSKVRLLGEALCRLELHLNNKVAVIALDSELLESLNMEKADTSGIIQTILAMEGIEVAVVLKEAGEGAKASLRSRNDIDVRAIAEVFGGGGHIKAAGLMQKDVTITEAKKNILNEIEKVM
ncbi:MAG: DHH family phosphoesterase [Clostridium sp.]